MGLNIFEWFPTQRTITRNVVGLYRAEKNCIEDYFKSK